MIKSCNSSGSIFIELAFSIPIVLLLLGSIIFVSEIITAKGQLSFAVSEGPRLATTRGNINFNSIENSGTILSTTAMPSLNSYIDGTNSNLPQILYSGFDESVALNKYNTIPTQWYSISDTNTAIVNNFSTAHPIDIYALAYTYGIFRTAIPEVKYPCDPTSNDPAESENCLLCQIALPLPPTTSACPLPGDTSSPHYSCPYDRALPDVGVICMYNPKGITGRIIDRLIKFFTNGQGSLAQILLTTSTYPAGIPTSGGGGIGGA